MKPFFKSILIAAALASPVVAIAAEPLKAVQITHGPQHHFFGYIGHVGNTPWNGDGRYLVALRTNFQEHMPSASEAADIVLLDAQDNYSVTKIEETRAWNFQQGTMFYWNPDAPDTQLFFNDRDSETNHVFTVLYDIAEKKRVREFRFDDTPFANGGVAQKGGFFLGLNYAALPGCGPSRAIPRPMIGQRACFTRKMTVSSKLTFAPARRRCWCLTTNSPKRFGPRDPMWTRRPSSSTTR